jgi:hypothetical protein
MNERAQVVSDNMNKIVASLLCLFLLLSIYIAVPASAADEDTQASVYLVFDPDTGEFVTVDDADATAQHKAKIDQEAIESGIEIENSPDKSPLTWRPGGIGIAALVILLGGAVWFMRKRKRTD